jgi:zinc transporter 5/7
MASTYALPAAPTSHAHGHERSSSQYTPYANGASSNNHSSQMTGYGHAHTQSDLSEKGELLGAVRSPYAEYNGHAHEHNHSHSHSQSHERAGSRDSSWTLKPFANARPKPRPRGESDLGRTPPRKNASAAKYGFPLVSPIAEIVPAVHVPSS